MPTEDTMVPPARPFTELAMAAKEPEAAILLNSA